GNILEKNRAEMELTAARNTVSMLQIEIEAAENRLRTLNGGEQIVFTDTEYAPLAELLPLADMEALYSTADPALLVAASQVKIAEQSVKVERAKTLPQFTVGYKLAHSTGQHFNGVVVGMSVPIFSGYRNTRAAKAQAAYAEAEHLSAVNDVRTSLAAMYERMEVLERSIAEYRQIESEMSDYRSYLSRAIEAGQISIIDYYSSLANYYDVVSARIDFERQLQQVHAEITSVML
ncbi:MAG: TolC family protein, partial [Rikenellaceae bacterium]|nr:TolC family protein [Rikenellaceae bacterium]